MRVTIADDHQIIRVGLRSILHAESDIQVVAEATSCAEARTAVEQAKPDVAILDLNLPDGSGLSIVPALLEALTDAR